MFPPKSTSTCRATNRSFPLKPLTRRWMKFFQNRNRKSLRSAFPFPTQPKSWIPISSKSFSISTAMRSISLAPIPWVRDAGEHVSARHFKHIGLYVFRRDALLEFPALPPGELERLEQLEQLRWLENGYDIRVAECAYEGIAVDTPADVVKVEDALRARQAAANCS